jgi:hypothetical protein
MNLRHKTLSSSRLQSGRACACHAAAVLCSLLRDACALAHASQRAFVKRLTPQARATNVCSRLQLQRALSCANAQQLCGPAAAHATCGSGSDVADAENPHAQVRSRVRVCSCCNLTVPLRLQKMRCALLLSTTHLSLCAHQGLRVTGQLLTYCVQEQKTHLAILTMTSDYMTPLRISEA